MKFTNLVLDEKGIYRCQKESRVSFPDDGHSKLELLEENSFWFVHRNYVINNIISKFIEKKAVLYDVGGGNGIVSKSLQKSGYHPVLVEPHLIGATTAKRRGVDTVVCAKLEDIDLQNRKLDAICLFDVIEHIEDDKNYLQNIRDYLSENGHVCITVPAYRFLWSHEDIHAGHFRRYTQNQLINLLKDSGFEVKFSSYFFTILIPVIFIFRTLPFLLGIASKANKNMLKEHRSVNDSLIGKLIVKLLNIEVEIVKKGLSLPFGGSLIVLAQKK